MKRNTKTLIIAVVAIGGGAALFATGVLNWEKVVIRLNWAAGRAASAGSSLGGNPNVNVHDTVLAAQCRANLALIESAKRRIAASRGLVGGMAVSISDVNAELAKMGSRPPLSCPAGGKYDLRPVGMSCKCSIGANNSAPKEDDHINLN